MSNLVNALTRKGLTYPQALRISRRVLEARRTKEFYSLEFSPSYAILYTENGGEYVYPVPMNANMRGGRA